MTAGEHLEHVPLIDRAIALMRERGPMTAVEIAAALADVLEAEWHGDPDALERERYGDPGEAAT